MLAKLIFCLEDPTLETRSAAPLSKQLPEAYPYQWAVNDLTTGKLVDLLVCLDELGFRLVEGDSGQVDPGF